MITAPRRSSVVMIQIAMSGAVVLSLLVAPGKGRAANRLGGAGALSCRVLAGAAASRTPEARDAVQWSLDYLTGRVQSGAGEDHRMFRGPDGIVVDLIAYCRRHRDAQVADAAASFFTHPITRKVKTPDAEGRTARSASSGEHRNPPERRCQFDCRRPGS